MSPCPHEALRAALAWRAGSAPIPAGRLLWITGLSGVGKTSLARALLQRMPASDALHWLDGDALRAHFGIDSVDVAARRALAHRYAAIAAGLARDGAQVLVSTISLFHCVHAANRAAGVEYREIWLRAPEAVRRSRCADRGGGPRVGIEIAAEFPREPHLTLDNDDVPRTLARLADRVLALQ